MYTHIDIIEKELEELKHEAYTDYNKLVEALDERDRYKNILFEFLKSKIGKKIYWAHPNWKKYETHTISDITLDIQENTFFGAQYKGKECIKIHVKNGGHFIADNIGKTLFFDEQEAAEHSYKEEI